MMSSSRSLVDAAIAACVREKIPVTGKTIREQLGQALVPEEILLWRLRIHWGGEDESERENARSGEEEASPS